MITKEQALDALDTLWSESDSTRVDTYNLLYDYIQQMEAIMEIVGEIVDAYGTTHNSKVFDAIDKLETTLKEMK